ncbi:hypothetical protein GCM10028805_24130 [Spirosoma harenae]
MDKEISLRIILEGPTAGVDFGLQKGSGHHYETVQKQRSQSQDLRFDFTVRVKGDPDNDVYPTLLGPFVQGNPSARFVYIDVGSYAGQPDSKWSGRMKIPLPKISWDVAHQLLGDVGQALVTQVSGTGKDEGPPFGTIKPFAGWQPA